MNELSRLETDRLRALLPLLLCEERDGLVGFLLHLAEFDRRRGWEGLNYGTLWDYCAGELKLQKGCIFRRTNAAKVLQRFPLAADRLRSGALTMSTLIVLKDVLTEGNSEEIMTLAEWKSKDDVVAIVAERMPPKVAPTPMIRKLPPAGAARLAPARCADGVPAAEQEAEVIVVESATPAPSTQPQSALAWPSAPERTIRTIEATPLGEERYAFRGVATREFAEKLRCAKEILSHSIPDGDPIKVLERALDLLIEKHAKRVTPSATGRTKAQRAPHVSDVLKTRGSTPASGRKGRPHIPAEVERAVRTRDADCCVFVLADGRRCGSRWKLQLDHVVAWARGGESTVENLRTVCIAHNALHARRTFGETHMSRYGASARPPSQV